LSLERKSPCNLRESDSYTEEWERNDETEKHGSWRGGKTLHVRQTRKNRGLRINKKRKNIEGRERGAKTEVTM